MSIEIANESGVEVDSDAILAVARHALDEMGVNPLAELSILLVDADYMAELNHRWMDADGPTDVLAFPMDEGSEAGGRGRPRDPGRAGPAHRARHAAPARLRPRRAGRGARDVQPAGSPARQLARVQETVMPHLTLLAVAAGLVVLAGLFAMTDAALAAVSPARAAELAREGVRGARALQAVAADAPRYINLLLLLRLACELVATTLVALVSAEAFGVGWRAALTTAGPMIVISFVLVGVGPRTIGRQHAYAVGQGTAPLVRWLGRALGPLATLLIMIGNAVTPGRGYREGPFATTVELRELVDLAEQRGVVEHGERDMIHS